MAVIWLLAKIMLPKKPASWTHLTKEDGWEGDNLVLSWKKCRGERKQIRMHLENSPKTPTKTPWKHTKIPMRMPRKHQATQSGKTKKNSTHTHTHTLENPRKRIKQSKTTPRFWVFGRWGGMCRDRFWSTTLVTRSAATAKSQIASDCNRNSKESLRLRKHPLKPSLLTRDPQFLRCFDSVSAASHRSGNPQEIVATTRVWFRFAAIFLPSAIFVIATLRFYCDFCRKSLRLRSCDCQSLAICDCNCVASVIISGPFLPDNLSDKRQHVWSLRECFSWTWGSSPCLWENEKGL